MKRILAYLAPSLFLVPAVALAINVSDAGNRYTDAGTFTTAERAAISVLTHENAVSGNPNGTFAAARTLNRAEFLKIALLSRNLNVPMNVDHDCFPDVKRADWFAPYVCESKRLGIVAGNPDGLFHPERPVNYVEALKILVTLHGYSLPLPGPTERWTWWRGYWLAAESHGVTLPGTISEDTLLTRGQAARIAAAFLAESQGELELYRAAERGEVSSSSRSSSSRSSSSSVSSTSSTSSRSNSSSTSSQHSRSSDPLPDTSVTRSTFVSFGEVTPILGSVRATSTLEPVTVTDVIIETTVAVPAVDSFLVYGNDRLFLGTATRSANSFSVHLQEPYKMTRNQQHTVYVRARIAEYDRIKDSGDTIDVSSITLKGTGDWTSENYSNTLTNDFPAVVTAREHFLEIAGENQSSSMAMSPGLEQSLLKFVVRATDDDNAESVYIESLQFHVSLTDASLTEIELAVAGSSSTAVGCTLNANIITCDGLPLTIGAVEVEKHLELRGILQNNQGSSNARAQVVLQNPGTPTSAGDILWNDGITSFTWTQFDTPVVAGPSFQQ